MSLIKEKDINIMKTINGLFSDITNYEKSKKGKPKSFEEIVAMIKSYRR